MKYALLKIKYALLKIPVTLVADLQFFRDPHNEIFREEYKEATLPQVV